MQTNETASLLEIAKGAIMEQTDVEVGKIIENILDPCTNTSKKRKSTITVEFAPNAERDIVFVNVTAKSQLQPHMPICASLYVGTNPETGELIATERLPQIPGQTYLDGREEEQPKTIKIT